YLVGIHLFFGLVLLKSDFIQRAGRKLGVAPVEEARPRSTSHFQRMLPYHSRMDKNLPDNAVIFIGDSMVQGLSVSAVAAPAVNYGIGGDTTSGVLARLPAYDSLKKARAIVVAVGINDMEIRDNAGILSNYAEILRRLPEDVPVIISAVLPVDEEIRTDWRGWNRDRIAPLNSELARLAHGSRNLHFVDAAPLLVDPRGNLAGELHVGDGLHLNPQGNAVWIEVLRAAVADAAPARE
ncbi:MAG: hypothetical protein GF355_16910, partial [Candidatus Eisenbacteria bacterium]|nr:hypothetical protein [Candidatus Eisenbacteria bacterium]